MHAEGFVHLTAPTQPTQNACIQFITYRTSYASSPTKIDLSDDAEAITFSFGWKIAEFTHPLWPGSTYNSSALNSSQMWTTRSALPPVTIVPSEDHEQFSRPFSALCVPPTKVLSCRFFEPDASSTKGRISHVFSVPSIELLSKCVPLGFSDRHVMVSTRNRGTNRCEQAIPSSVS